VKHADFPVARSEIRLVLSHTLTSRSSGFHLPSAETLCLLRKDPGRRVSFCLLRQGQPRAERHSASGHRYAIDCTKLAFKLLKHWFRKLVRSNIIGEHLPRRDPRIKVNHARRAVRPDTFGAQPYLCTRNNFAVRQIPADGPAGGNGGASSIWLQSR